MSGCSPAGTSQDRASKNRAPSSVPSWPCCCAGSHAGFLTSMPPPLSLHTVPATPSPELAPPPPIHGQKATFVLVRHGRTGAPEGAFWALTSPRRPLWPLFLTIAGAVSWGQVQEAPVPGGHSLGTSLGADPPHDIVVGHLVLWALACHRQREHILMVLERSQGLIEPVLKVRAGAPERDASYTCLSVSNARNSVPLTGYSCQGLLSLCLPVSKCRFARTRWKPGLRCPLTSEGCVLWEWGPCGAGWPRPWACCVVYENICYTRFLCPLEVSFE